MVRKRGGTRGIGRDKSPVTKSENSDNIKLVRKKPKKIKYQHTKTSHFRSMVVTGLAPTETSETTTKRILTCRKQ